MYMDVRYDKCMITSITAATQLVTHTLYQTTVNDVMPSAWYVH